MVTNRNLSNDLRQAVTDEFKKMTYPCSHSSNDVWGYEVIVLYPEDDTYKELRGKLETYKVSLPVDENTDLQTLAKEFVFQAEAVEQRVYEEAIQKWSQTYPIEILREAMECHELCGWSLLMHEGEGAICHGKATAVHYALYLPDLNKIKELEQPKENYDDNGQSR